MTETQGVPDRARRVFKRLTTDAYFNRITDNRVLVEWALEKDFEEVGPYVFTLYRGYAVTDDAWLPIAQTTDQPWLYDNSPIWPDMGTIMYYKVVLVDGNGVNYESQPVSIGSYWNQYDWSLAKEIVRKEHMLQRKRAGTKGWLVKRREWGDRCPCANPVTGQVNNAECPECYGTGVLGGYYEPQEYWVIMNPSQRVSKMDANVGLVTQSVETVRSLAYPQPASMDFWVHAHTDQRFLVMEDIVAIARHRGIDLVLNIRLQERGRNDPIYGVPTPC